ncbi:MAG: methionyl-tRNA formyltransferase [bacterium]
MKVVFTGASRFGLCCLGSIRDLPCVDVVGVITNEQDFKISYAPQGVSNVLYANFAEYAKQHDIACYTMKQKMNEPGLKTSLEQWQADIMIVVGWYHMVPKSILNQLPTYGMHASLLPDYSGGAPLVWAIINGEDKTGISLFQFADGVDNGPLVGQLVTPITFEDDIKTVYERIETLGCQLLRENLPLLASGEAPHQVQDESKRRICAQRKPADGMIDWGKTAGEIYNFVRAQTHPYPGAFTTLDDDKVMIWSAAVCERPAQADEAVGQLIICDQQLYVVCGDNSLLQLKQVEFNNEEQAAWRWYSQLEQKHRGLFV